MIILHNSVCCLYFLFHMANLHHHLHHIMCNTFTIICAIIQSNTTSPPSVIKDQDPIYELVCNLWGSAQRMRSGQIGLTFVSSLLSMFIIFDWCEVGLYVFTLHRIANWSSSGIFVHHIAKTFTESCLRQMWALMDISEPKEHNLFQTDMA